MKFTFEVNVKGDTTKAESFIQQVSDHLVEYIRQNNFIVESIDRKIAFSEEEQTAVPAEQPMENPMAEPEADVIPDMPMQAVGEKLKKLKEFYGIKSNKESWSKTSDTENRITFVRDSDKKQIILVKLLGDRWQVSTSNMVKKFSNKQDALNYAKKLMQE